MWPKPEMFFSLCEFGVHEVPQTSAISLKFVTGLNLTVKHFKINYFIPSCTYLIKVWENWRSLCCGSRLWRL